MNKNYNVAAYVWPSYHDDPRSRIFWNECYGEWQSVLSAKPKYPGHLEPRLPLWGAVNEADPYVMGMEIDAAADHAVDTFIYDWYWYDNRPFLEGCLNDGFLGAKNNSRMRFYLMWANHNATSFWNKALADIDETVVWSGKVNRPQLEQIARRLTEKYFSHPLYYKIDGKPVFAIYDIRNFVEGLGGLREAASALEFMRKEAELAGLGGLHLQLIVWNDSPINFTGVDSFGAGGVTTSRALVRALGFDSITHYQFVHFTNPDREYEDILKDVVKEWERLDAEYDVPYFPHISVGWDNNPRTNSFRPGVVKGNTPEAFEKALSLAKAYADSHSRKLITINSWNEWTETSFLQPDRLYGYGYLEAIKRVFGDR